MEEHSLAQTVEEGAWRLVGAAVGLPGLLGNVERDVEEGIVGSGGGSATEASHVRSELSGEDAMNNTATLVFGGGGSGGGERGGGRG